MGLALKFIRLPLNDKHLYLEAIFWLGISRFAILILPFTPIATPTTWMVYFCCPA